VQRLVLRNGVGRRLARGVRKRGWGYSFRCALR
jgi:hypothetical protein